MLKRIKKVEYAGDYKLKILFNDRKTKIVDFEEWISEGGYYMKPLKNKKYFQSVEVDEEIHTIVWRNGADFCPDVLYKMGIDFKK